MIEIIEHRSLARSSVRRISDFEKHQALTLPRFLVMLGGKTENFAGLNLNEFYQRLRTQGAKTQNKRDKKIGLCTNYII